MTTRQWLIVTALLFPPWAAFMVQVFWFVDPATPMEIVYQHDAFLGRPAFNREDAKKFELHDVDSGQAVWIYREVCMDGSHSGTVQARWIAGAFEWASPERPVVNDEKFCGARSSNLIAPTSSPTRTFTYKAQFVFEVNPLRTVIVNAPPINVTVHAPFAPR